MTTLRWYQVKLNTATDAFLVDPMAGQRGQVYAPTGAGKTVCFIELIKNSVVRGKKNIAILHPRIALSQDQLRRTTTSLGTDEYYFTSFHSGGTYNTKGQTVKSTTNATELKRVIKQANGLGKVHITFSSYHSFDKIINGCDKFDLVICDEAHYLTQDTFYKYVKGINADKILFYTATPITNELEDDFMMDFTVFGPVIEKVEPKELIKDGYIVAPLIHKLECSTFAEGSGADVVDIVARAFVEQHKEVTNYGMTFAQMLVASRGCPDLRRLEDELKNLWFKIKELSEGKLSQVDLYTIDSTGSYRNGIEVPGGRPVALEKIKASNGNCIVAHFDTLSEGIDIDTLTGAVLMRRMSKAKILQTIGRCARPYIGDLDKNFEPRKDLFDLDKGIDKRKKRRCIVTLPVINGAWIANSDGKDIAEAFIIGGYDDLLTYVNNSDDPPKGKGTVDFELPDNNKTLDAAIQNSYVERELAELRELFEGLYA